MTGALSRDRLAILAGLAAPLALAAVLIPFRASFPNTDAALALLLVVVAVAANGNRLAGVLAALSAAVWFDFFLTQPYERFTITRRTDIETTVLLLAIGVAVTEIAVWGRRQHAAASRRAGYLDGINAAAKAVATGDSPAALIDQVSARLTELLSLTSCRVCLASLSGAVWYRPPQPAVCRNGSHRPCLAAVWPDAGVQGQSRFSRSEVDGHG